MILIIHGKFEKITITNGLKISFFTGFLFFRNQVLVPWKIKSTIY